MTTEMFRAFAQHAAGGPDTPNDYVAVKIAAAKMFPKLADYANDLARRASMAGRLRPPPIPQPVTKLLKAKLANVPMGSPISAVAHAGSGMLGHAIELGGLGILAQPSIQKLRGRQVTHKSEAKHELLGLGTLAAPSAYHLLTRH